MTVVGFIIKLLDILMWLLNEWCLKYVSGTCWPSSQVAWSLSSWQLVTFVRGIWVSRMIWGEGSVLSVCLHYSCSFTASVAWASTKIELGSYFSWQPVSALGSKGVFQGIVLNN